MFVVVKLWSIMLMSDVHVGTSDTADNDVQNEAAFQINKICS